MSDVKGVELTVFLVLFLIVTVLGFLASRWRKAESMDSLDEWGLGGRGFGTFVSWFLIGGDIYTAYTFIAVPATLYAGSVVGFFAVPYTIVLYPLIFVFVPRFWSVSHRHGYVTPADFVRGRFDSKLLALAVALTGLLATMPYIALQLVGIQVVLQIMGVGGSEDASWLEKDAPLLIAFAVLAAYTYASGLRAPALIAFVKDTLIYIVIIVAVIALPIKLGGWDDIFRAASDSFAAFNKDNADAIASGAASAKGQIPPGAAHWAYASLALGSALALFMYPHSLTGVLASKNRSVIRRNAALLPAYSFLLGLLALLGFAAIAAGVKVDNPQLSVPALFDAMFPDWFAGVAFAAIAIGALVPAAIMSIAAANLWTRNIYTAFINPDATPKQEARQSKLVSLVVKFGALVFVLGLGTQDAINFQLLGGVWILQTFPALVFALYTRWFHRWALLAGWAVGMVFGTLTAYHVPVVGKPGSHFGGPLQLIPFTETKGYIALTAFVLNVLVGVVLTFVFRALKVDEGVDHTHPTDYHADAGDAGVTDVLEGEPGDGARGPVTILVRPAHTDELVLVGELTAAAYAADGFVTEHDDYAEHLRDAATRAREAEVYVAVLPSGVAGTVTFCPQGSPWQELASPQDGELRMLAVDPAARRQGVAAALVGACIERSRELGYRALVLSSMPVQQPAHRVYERLGFRRTPERDWWPTDTVELLAFRLDLS